MDELFTMSLSYCIEKVIWHHDEKELEKQIRDNEFDTALEWQYGHQDHTVLDLVEKYHEKASRKIIPEDYVLAIQQPP
jgi:hypothetical protein